MTRREVRVADQFFERLDELLPTRRTIDGLPSGTDFLLHDIPSVIDRLAEDFESATIPSGYDEGTRVLVATGLLVTYFVVYATIIADGSVEVFYLDLA